MYVGWKYTFTRTQTGFSLLAQVNVRVCACVCVYFTTFTKSQTSLLQLSIWFYCGLVYCVRFALGEKLHIVYMDISQFLLNI